jgi:hypothetical protein
MSKIKVNDLTYGKKTQRIADIPFGTFFYCQSEELTLIVDFILKLEDSIVLFQDFQGENIKLRVYKYGEKQVVYNYAPVNVSINTWRDR